MCVCVCVCVCVSVVQCVCVCVSVCVIMMHIGFNYRTFVLGRACLNMPVSKPIVVSPIQSCVILKK